MYANTRFKPSHILLLEGVREMVVGSISYDDLSSYMTSTVDNGLYLQCMCISRLLRKDAAACATFQRERETNNR